MGQVGTGHFNHGRSPRPERQTYAQLRQVGARTKRYERFGYLNYFKGRHRQAEPDSKPTGHPLTNEASSTRAETFHKIDFVVFAAANKRLRHSLRSTADNFYNLNAHRRPMSVRTSVQNSAYA